MMNTRKIRTLITSGGTAVPIDPVRSITNSSTGNFAASLAKSALLNDMEVIYLAAHNSKSPCSCHLDLQQQSIDSLDTEWNILKVFYEKYKHFYKEYRYQFFEEYQHLLHALITQEKPDIIILAAAVSDYTVQNYSLEKVRSHAALDLQLHAAPKLIEQVKTWLPSAFLIGFKLLIDASSAELITTAKQSMQKHKADAVIANNLSSIQQNNHTIFLIEPQGKVTQYNQNLAEHVIDFCQQKVLV